jgi:hypothetical protein
MYYDYPKDKKKVLDNSKETVVGYKEESIVLSEYKKII